MLLSPEIALVSGEVVGEGDCADDCNVYAVRTADGTVLVDAGTGRSVEQIVSTAQADGLAAGGVTALLLTHAHLDHAGGASRVQSGYGADVYASAETARRLATADEEAIALPAARASGMYRPDDRLLACEVDRVLADGDQFEIGGVVFRAMATPGHARDHIAFMADIGGRRVFFAGDLLFPGGQVALLNTHDCCLRQLVGTLESLRGLEFDWLLSGHLPPLLTQATDALESALATLDALAIPRSIV